MKNPTESSNHHHHPPPPANPPPPPPNFQPVPAYNLQPQAVYENNATSLTPSGASIPSKIPTTPKKTTGFKKRGRPKKSTARNLAPILPASADSATAAAANATAANVAANAANAATAVTNAVTTPSGPSSSNAVASMEKPSILGTTKKGKKRKRECKDWYIEKWLQDCEPYQEYKKVRVEVENQVQSFHL